MRNDKEPFYPFSFSLRGRYIILANICFFQGDNICWFNRCLLSTFKAYGDMQGYKRAFLKRATESEKVKLVIKNLKATNMHMWEGTLQ